MAAVNADTITDRQIVDVVDLCGWSPGYRDAYCPKCGATAPDHCRNRTRAPHMARKQVRALLVFLWRERCADVWNTRHGGSDVR